MVELATDPACGMEVDQSNPGAVLTHEGHTYYFCSEGCREQFEAKPERFVDTDLLSLSQLAGITTPRVVDEETNARFELEMAGERPDVGDRVTYTKTVTDDDVFGFARSTGDTNALHLNETFAERTRFGRRIAHGTLVAGHVSAALASFPGVTTYLEQTLAFHRPVDIGEQLVTTCRIVDRVDGNRYQLSTTVENEDEETVLDGSAEVLVDELPLT